MLLNQVMRNCGVNDFERPFQTVRKPIGFSRGLPMFPLLRHSVMVVFPTFEALVMQAQEE